MNTKELTVFLKYCSRNPKCLPVLFQSLGGGVRRKFIRSLHRLANVSTRLSHYPGEIKSMVRNIELPREKTIYLNRLPHTGWEPGNGPPLQEWSIPLATQSISLCDIKWDYKYNDREDIFALNRFIWMLRWLSLRPSLDEFPCADTIILDWIDQMGKKKYLPSWESYSVSERVVNWLLYLCITRGFERLSTSVFQKIISAIFHHLEHLLYHLEYHFLDYSNHILNNARALYIGGRLLRYYQISEIGEKLLRFHVPVLIDNGFLREGSSHYQLLITRTLTECNWCASITEDFHTHKWLVPIVKKMQFACSLFFIGQQPFPHTFPRIGDVSPDFPVKWFYYNLDNLFSVNESWFNLWNQDVIKPYIYVLTKPDFSKKWMQNGWIRAQNGRFTLLATSIEHENIYPVAHGHMDFGSFMLYDNSFPLIVDRGRFSYEKEAFGMYGYAAQSHNVVTVNGLPVLSQSRSIYKPYSFLISHNSKQSVEFDSDIVKIGWYSNGFGRFADGLEWKRIVLLHQNYVSITDEIRNPKRYKGNLHLFFHLNPEVEIIRKEATLTILHKSEKIYDWSINGLTSDASIRIRRGEDNFSLDGWHFPEYGVKVSAPTIIIYVAFNNNVAIESRILKL